MKLLLTFSLMLMLSFSAMGQSPIVVKDSTLKFGEYELVIKTNYIEPAYVDSLSSAIVLKDSAIVDIRNLVVDKDSLLQAAAMKQEADSLLIENLRQELSLQVGLKDSAYQTILRKDSVLKEIHILSKF